MAKRHRTKKQKARNRKYIQHNRERKFCSNPHAENYYKEQAKIINNLKPVMAAARRFKERRDKLTPAPPYVESE